MTEMPFGTDLQHAIQVRLSDLQFSRPRMSVQFPLLFNNNRNDTPPTLMPDAVAAVLHSTVRDLAAKFLFFLMDAQLNIPCFVIFIAIERICCNSFR